MKHSIKVLPFVLLVSVSMLACIVAFSTVSGRLNGMNVLRNFMVNLPIYLFIGYVDYKIISWSHKWHAVFNAWSVLIDIVVANLLLCLLSLVYIYIRLNVGYSGFQFIQLIILSVFCNSIIVLVVEVFFYNQQLLENKAHLATIEKEKAQYQLEALKNQINPHFLFNSLNVLSSLAYQDAAKANLFTKNLSSVYRYLLNTQELTKVPLQDELDFVESYIYLEQIRFGDKLRINMDFGSKNVQGKYIVPASIQMLVENATKHNINTREMPLVVNIRIDDNRVTVANNLQLRNSVSRNRVGLKNLEKQYNIHGKHIEVVKSDTEFRVTLPLL